LAPSPCPIRRSPRPRTEKPLGLSSKWPSALPAVARSHQVALDATLP
jgi:hypothetical protein